MGTSISSKGPGGNVPLVPPWVPQVQPLLDIPTNAIPEPQPDPQDSPPPNQDNTQLGQSIPILSPPIQMAPKRRFAGARNSLRLFAQTGDQQYLKNGLRHYTRTGLGGARNATLRMGGTARTAGTLFNALNAFRTQSVDATDFGLDPNTLRGQSAREIGARIIEAIRPKDGTLDAVANRESINNAFKDLMNQHADADLLALTPEQIESVIERYLAYDICRRVEMDIGGAVHKAASGAAEGVRRMEEMKTYIREKVFACFRSLRARGHQLTRALAASFASQVIKDTFTVFEEYIR